METCPDVKMAADKLTANAAKKCTEAIEAALKEYGCCFQVAMIPQVTVIPKPKP